MSDLPRLELTGDPNKNNDFIIYRNSYKKMVNAKTVTKRMSSTQTKWKKRNKRKTRKSLFNIFS
jgi:hypothetical protein